MDILADGRRVRSIFIDLAPQLKREQRLLGYLIDCDGSKVLAVASKKSNADQTLAISRLAAQMHNDLLVEESAAKEVCQTYMDVLCNREPQKAAVTPPPASPVAPKPAPTPYVPPKTVPVPPVPTTPSSVSQTVTTNTTTVPASPKTAPAQAVSQNKTSKKPKKYKALRFIAVAAVLIGILTYFANTSAIPSSNTQKASKDGVISGTIVCTSSYQGDPDGEKPIGNYIYLYNTDGKCVYEKYEDHQVTLFDYDSSGNLIKESVYYDDQLFSVIEYDTFGNSTKELHYSGSGELTSSKEWSNNYDDQGRVDIRSHCTDGFGELIDYDYNADGSYYTWDIDYFYDEATKEHLQDCCNKYTYFDSNGNVIKKIVTQEDTLELFEEYTFTYDAHQNLIQSTVSTESICETYDYENIYNDDGQLAEMLKYVSSEPVTGVSDGSEQELLYRVTYDYDYYGNCIREEKSFYNKETDSFDPPIVSVWERDALGLLHSYTFAGELYASYEYANLKNALYS